MPQFLNSVSLSASSLDVSLGDKTLTVTMDLTGKPAVCNYIEQLRCVLTHSTTGAEVNLNDCSYTDPNSYLFSSLFRVDQAGVWTIKYIYLKDTPGSLKTYHLKITFPGLFL